MSDVLPPKRQAAVDRLRRRIDLYAKDHQGRHLHYERIVPTLCEQQMQESFALKQKYLDPKAKKPSKSKNSSASGSSSSSSNNGGAAGGGSSSGIGSSSTSVAGSNTPATPTSHNISSAVVERKAPATDAAAITQSNTQSVSLAFFLSSWRRRRPLTRLPQRPLVSVDVISPWRPMGAP